MKKTLAMICVAALAAGVLAGDADRFKTWESANDLTETTMRTRWEGDVLVWAEVPGMTSAQVCQAVNAVTDQQVAEYLAGIAEATPLSLVPEMDEAGNATGRVYQQCVVDGVLSIVLYSASPPRPVAERKADIAAKAAARAEIERAGKQGINGQLQARIANIERALGWRLE